MTSHKLFKTISIFVSYRSFSCLLGVNRKKEILTLSWSFDWISFLTSISSLLAIFGRQEICNHHGFTLSIFHSMVVTLNFDHYPLLVRCCV